MPVPTWPGDDDGSGGDLLVSLSARRSAEELVAALKPLTLKIRVEELFSQAPIFWWRLRATGGIERADVMACLSKANVAARYVASALRPSLAVAPRLSHNVEGRCSPRNWPTRRGTPAPDADSPGRWFLRSPSGIAINRSQFGDGSGTRLAVIDDEAAGVADLDLDAQVLVNVTEAPHNTLHGATMVALAVGTRRSASGEDGFQGVAPFACPRLYCTPKPGEDVLSLPLAIVRATDDGADVIVCASYIEGTTSPMLDEALEFAVRYGRKGRGTAIVFPVGRETASPDNSSHASLSLALGDPASDPRAFAIGPSGKEGGWFLWRDRKGRLRPFANRGPAVRWLAPGDDLVFPFDRAERLFHAESSGASAIAAGAILLVLSANPTLRLTEVDAILTRTASPVAGEALPAGPLADVHDVQPTARDPDGHDAKHGYGRLHASRACLAAADPIAAALVSIGEEPAALIYSTLRSSNEAVRSAYSRRFARWMARALIADATLLHGVKSVGRHVRGVAASTRRQRAHGRGSLIRQIVLVLRAAGQSRSAPRPSVRVSEELDALLVGLETARSADTDWDQALYAVLAPLWAGAPP